MKLNSQTWESHWQEIMGKLREKWEWLNEQDLEKARGDIQQLVKIIHQRTGESREAVQELLDALVSNYSDTVQQAAEAIRSYAGQAAESVQEATDYASESVRSGVRESREMVRRHPMESLLTCFGVGILTGILAGALIRSR